MADAVHIFHLPDGKEWAEYLQDTFMSDTYDIQSVLKDYRLLTRENANGLNAKMNILLITPELIEDCDLDLWNEFGGGTSVAVLAGVDNDEWATAKAVLNLESELDWFIYELEANEGSVRDLVVFIVSLYESIERQSPRHSLSGNESIPSATEDEPQKNNVETEHRQPGSGQVQERSESRLVSGGSIYDPLPATRPLHTVTHVFRKGDNVYLVLEGINNGIVKVKFQESGQEITAACVSEKATLVSFQHSRAESETFEVTLDDIEIGYGEIERESQLIDTEYLDRASSISTSSGVSSRISELSIGSATYRLPPPHQFLPPAAHYANEQGPSSVAFASPTKLEQLHTLLKDVLDPVGVLCQSLRIPDGITHLDEALTEMLLSTETLEFFSSPPLAHSYQDSRGDSVWPTLLHFGAHFGLFQLCVTLVNNPLTKAAAVMRNVDQRYPHDIARVKGHIELYSCLRKVYEDMINRNSDRSSGETTSGIPQAQNRSNRQKTPPPVQPRTKFGHMEDVATKGILKRSSQGSLKSEDGYDSVNEWRKQRDDSVSISSNDSLRVTFGTPVPDNEDERIPIPSTDHPYDGYNNSSHSIHTTAHSTNRTSNPIAIPRPSTDEDLFAETRRKDIADFLGMEQLSSSVPSKSYMNYAEKPEHHGFFDKFRRKKTPPKKVDDRRSVRTKPGEKTKVYTHKKEPHDDRDSSAEEEEEGQFRSRLNTYPYAGQILRRPNVKKMKEKHAAAVKELASPNLGSKDDSHAPQVVLRTDSQNSKGKKDKKSRHSDKKKHDDKDHNKSRIQRIVQHASVRRSARFHIAQNEQHTSAPPLPPRPLNIGRF